MLESKFNHERSPSIALRSARLESPLTGLKNKRLETQFIKLQQLAEDFFAFFVDDCQFDRPAVPIDFHRSRIEDRMGIAHAVGVFLPLPMMFGRGIIHCW